MFFGRNFWIFLVFAIGLTVFSGCRPERNLEMKSAEARSNLPADGRHSGDSPIVARIGDREISFAEITDNLDSLPVFVRMRYKSPERRLEFLEAFIEYQLIALAAVAEGFEKDPVVLDELKMDLAARYVRDNVDLKFRTTDIPEQEIRAWYDEHPYQFSRPGQNHVYRILLSSRSEAEKVAFRVAAQVEAATGEPLEVFKRHVALSSKDPDSWKDHGDIGYFPYGGTGSSGVPPAVEAEAESMTTLFSVSGPVEAEDGWSVLFLAGKRPPLAKDLDQARAGIAGMILDRRRLAARRELADSLIEPLRKQGRISVDSELLQELAAQDTAARINAWTENQR